jgi:hypothetical protein
VAALESKPWLEEKVAEAAATGSWRMGAGAMAIESRGSTAVVAERAAWQPILGCSHRLREAHVKLGIGGSCSPVGGKG